jgi:predicted GNAT family acetyltransferase
VALRREELEEDPRLVDEPAYRRQAQAECREGTTFVWREADGLRFRASLGGLTASAAQVSAVYTPPEHRNRGFATRGLGELCHRLLQRVPHVCLFVNDFNQPALAVYRKLGFRSHAAWRSVFWGPRTPL